MGAGVAAIPLLTIKRDMVGNILFMFIDYTIPMGLVGWYLGGGLLDYFVYKFEASCAGKNSQTGYAI